MVNVTALVVNWSTPEDLYECVTSAMAFEPDLTWSIWQNRHPEISSHEVLRQLGTDYPRQIVSQNGQENFGHGYGINRAADLAAKVWPSRYYFVVNPDCVWTEPVTAELVEFLEEDPQRCMVGPKQMDSRFRITAGGIFGSNQQPQHRYWHTPDRQNVLARDVREAVVVAGSAFLISKDDFFSYHGLLEAAHYYSETWLCYHVRAHDRTVWYYGKRWMIHEWHRSTPVGFSGTDGKFKDDREMFRQMCDEHDPPIERD